MIMTHGNYLNDKMDDYDYGYDDYDYYNKGYDYNDYGVGADDDNGYLDYDDEEAFDYYRDVWDDFS